MVHEVASLFKLEASGGVRERKVVDVSRMYMQRARKPRRGEKGRIKAIQPRWAVEEYAKSLRT